jgi:polyhydroxybutyrate depolymerase
VAAPLLILLHGYGQSGASQDSYFDMKKVADANGMIYLYPNGLVDYNKARYWKATEACCDFLEVGQDDTAYLIGLIDQVAAVANIDRSRVYFVGFSNGGFMAYKLACEHSEHIAAIAILAGSTFKNPADCKAQNKVSVLHIHGTADNIILYEGGVQGNGKEYPSVSETLNQWTTFNGCTPNSFQTWMPSFSIDRGV